MTTKITQTIVNQKCQLLMSQKEDITINKVRKLIDGEIYIIDLVDKVALFKQDPKQAKKAAENEYDIIVHHAKENLLELIEDTLLSYNMQSKECSTSIRNKLAKYINTKVKQETQKLKVKLSTALNLNSSLEISNLTLDKSYNKLLEKYYILKEENCMLKQKLQSNTIVNKTNQDNLAQNILAWNDFRSVEKQTNALESSSKKIATYDKRGYIVIKFPATDYLTKECRSGSSKYLQSKIAYDYNSRSWILSEFINIYRTAEFLKRNKFVFSKELEAIIYHL